MKEFPWHHVFDPSREPVAEVLPSGRLGYMNPAFRQLFDALGRDLRGRSWRDLFADVEALPLQEALDEALTAGVSQIDTLRISPKIASGHVSVALARVPRAGPKPTTAALLVRSAAGNLRGFGEGRGSHAEVSAPQSAAVLLIDAAGRIEEGDDGAAATFGVEGPELQGRPWTTLLHSVSDESSLGIQEATQILSDLAGSGVAPAVGQRSDGQVFAARVRVSRRSSVEGGFVLLVQDVTPLRGLQSALDLSELQTRAALRELQLLENAFDQHAIVAVTDRAGRILYANDKFCELSRYSREELLGQNHRIINSGHHPKSFFRELWTTISRGDTWRGEICNRTKEGSLYWVETTIVPIDSAGERRYVSIRTDVTEQKRIQEQLVQAAKMAAIGELAGHISHEVNNPLGIISAKARLILSDLGAELSPRLVRDLGKIINQCDRLSRLTRGLLDFARPSLGTRSVIPVHDALHRVIDLVRDRIVQGGGEFVVELAERLPKVYGNPGELEQVFLNLLLNAIDAIDVGGRVCLTTEASGTLSDGREGIVIRVEDDGDGMDEPIQQRIFEPFFTTKEPGRGTGLGLSICQGLVRSHEGELTVESSPGQGTRFEVRLPVPESGAEEAPKT